MTIFPTCYFAPIAWYAAALRTETLYIETAEHYRKQQYSNRMWIKTANGVLSLVVPVERTGERKAIRDKKIAYHTTWQKTHWKSLETAYRSSPYFEYYEDKFRCFYEKKHDFLLDFNMEIQNLCLNLLQIEKKIETISVYEKEGFYDTDYRNSFDASLLTEPHWFKAAPYTQVFEGFHANLSIFDLLCNEGPNGKAILVNSLLR